MQTHFHQTTLGRPNPQPCQCRHSWPSILEPIQSVDNLWNTFWCFQPEQRAAGRVNHFRITICRWILLQLAIFAQPRIQRLMLSSFEDACNHFFFSRPISDCTQSLYLIAHLWSRNTQYVNLWSEPISLTPRGQAPARFAERRGGLLTLLSDSEQLSIKLMVQPPRLKKSWQALKRSEPAIAIYFAGYKSTSNPTASSSSPTFDYSLPSSLVRRKHVTFYDFHDHDWNFWVNFVRIWTNWGLSTPQLRRPRILSGWLTHFEII